MVPGSTTTPVGTASVTVILYAGVFPVFVTVSVYGSVASGLRVTASCPSTFFTIASCGLSTVTPAASSSRWRVLSSPLTVFHVKLAVFGSEFVPKGTLFARSTL